ncbi:GMC family oxidoreductase [Altericroceibacterium spongiae]|uniref:GMC family oxidoreductase n=1 Tax=Altericroceibacterium spongiae TaxID=2320269 RepID=A0A420EQP1_9SPHN|nr:GMC family oxidoreductase [Altericroceibacterium spongiae]RKF23008.1 GMC family oxidoreductase [Altericroceibacterium spongiae]
MLIDLATSKPDRLDSEIAIIGAGAAGITLARSLTERGISVLLLESGGLDYEDRTADLNAGENIGQDYYPLDHARLRFFGGTTAIWGGRCSQLDPIDFEKRDWVPHSGWPFPHADILPYYEKARGIFGLPWRTPTEKTVRAAGVPLPRFSESELATPLWSFDSKFDRFSMANCRDLAEHPQCTIVLHATIREIVAAADGASVARLDVVAPDGTAIDVQARDYILAAGGIENPRLLLASRSVMPCGLGNQSDQVGRYFMEHPHARGGRIVRGDAWKLFDAFAKRTLASETVAPLIAPSAQLQAEQGLLNTSLTIAPRRPADGREAWAMRAYLHAKEKRAPNRMGRSLWKMTKRSVGWLQQKVDPARPWLLNKLGRLDVALVVRAEQAPNPDSRVLLSEQDRDALGMPRVKLNWQTTALDTHSVAGLVAALGRETKRLNLGTVEPAPWLSDPSAEWKTDPLISAHPIGGYHHMGTTRMAEDPAQGVTDGHAKVHGLANLHIAGSSLFPTSGWANPTLTIVALALRLADRLADNRLAER